MVDTIQTSTTQIPLLLQLPNELLHQIFKDCDKYDSPICKDLLPFTRAAIYQFAKIESLELFKFFIQTILSNPSVGHLVLELNIRIASNTIPSQDYLSTSEVVRAIVLLKRLRSLSLDWEYLARLIFLDVEYLVPSLEELILFDPFRSNPQPWNDKPFADLLDAWNLTRLHLNSLEQNKFNLHDTSLFILRPELNKVIDLIVEETTSLSVSLQVERGLGSSIVPSTTTTTTTTTTRESGALSSDTDDRPKSSQSTTSSRSQHSIVSRERASIDEMYINVLLDEPELLKIILWFRGLRTLRISEGVIGSSLIKLLESIPLDLYELDIYFDTERKYSLVQKASTALYPTITRVKDLEILTISAKVFTPAIFRYLRNPLPLTSQNFGFKTTYYSGSRYHLSSLKFLILEVVFAVAIDNGDESSGDENGTAHPGWRFADWTNDFDLTGVQELVNLEEKYGVSVTGSSVDAAEIEDEWEREIELAERMEEEMMSD